MMTVVMGCLVSLGFVKHFGHFVFSHFLSDVTISLPLSISTLQCTHGVSYTHPILVAAHHPLIMSPWQIYRLLWFAHSFTYNKLSCAVGGETVVACTLVRQADTQLEIAHWESLHRCACGWLTIATNLVNWLVISIDSVSKQDCAYHIQDMWECFVRIGNELGAFLHLWASHHIVNLLAPFAWNLSDHQMHQYFFQIVSWYSFTIDVPILLELRIPSSPVENQTLPVPCMRSICMPTLVWKWCVGVPGEGETIAEATGRGIHPQGRENGRPSAGRSIRGWGLAQEHMSPRRVAAATSWRASKQQTTDQLVIEHGPAPNHFTGVIVVQIWPSSHSHF